MSAVGDCISSLCHPRWIFSVLGKRFKFFSPSVSYNRDISLFSHSSPGSAGKFPQQQIVCSKKWEVQSLSSNREVIHGPGPTPQVIIYSITQASISGREQCCFKGAKKQALGTLGNCAKKQLEPLELQVSCQPCSCGHHAPGQCSKCTNIPALRRILALSMQQHGKNRGFLLQACEYYPEADCPTLRKKTGKTRNFHEKISSKQRQAVGTTACFLEGIGTTVKIQDTPLYNIF